MNIEGQRVLITGGSSGIGLVLARALLAKGAKIVISGRRSDVLAQAVEAAQRIDILVNNACGVRAGRLENTPEAELQAMIDVDLVAPIMLTRAALLALRTSADAMVVNVASSIALIGAPFYATYAATKAGLARFGETLRRELKGEGAHVLTAYPGGTDTPMMKSNRAGHELGFSREPAAAVADTIVEGTETNAFEEIRGGEAWAQMIALNRDHPAAVDECVLGLNRRRRTPEGSLGALNSGDRNCVWISTGLRSTGSSERDHRVAWLSA